MKIDAHQHFWELFRFEYDWLEIEQHEPIRRDFMPRDLLPHLDACNIDASIFVQTQHELAETRWALNLCWQCDFLAGVVGWVDLQSPECEQQLLEFRQDPKFLGIRHITQDEPDDDFIIRPDVLNGLKTLERYKTPFDLLFYPQQLQHAATVARHCPELPLVIDHLAKPNINSGRFDNWESNFRAAAECENMFCKLSGLITEADWQNWKPDDLRPYLEIALEVFGPERLMFGSDWPVCELAGSYEQVHELIEAFISPLSPTEQALIWGKTAQNFYGIPGDPTD